MRHLAIGVIFGVMVATAVSAESPYTGQQTREVKALSTQEVHDYLNGRGMGFAKAAELNHYPGPRHVLDLANELELGDEQRSRSEAIFEAMKAKAILLGTELVERESELDRQFASGAVSPESLGTLLSEIAALKGKLRYVHLLAHLEQRPVLSKQQIRLYDELRGYGVTSGSEHSHRHSHGD